MALPVTDKNLDSSLATDKTPNLILDIDGVEEKYAVVPTNEYLQVGDFIVGSSYIIGQLSISPSIDGLISYQLGTSSDIKQTLNIDKGTSSGTTSMKISMVDKSLKLSEVISPGIIVDDILGRKCRVWLGFTNVAYPEDYIVIFRGIVESTESKAGSVSLNLVAPDYKNRGSSFPKAAAKLTASMDASQTTATVDQTTDFLTPFTGPRGSIDDTLRLYIKIDSEVMRYEGTTSTSFTSLTRGALDTVAATHDIDASIDSIYVVTGNVCDLALKFMLSGSDSAYISGADVHSFRFIGDDQYLDNAIYFGHDDVSVLYNIREGDFITTTGASSGANNVTNKEILSITQGANGYYIVVDGVTFVTETNSTAQIAFKSQYASWGPNAGMKLTADEVDIAEHLSVQLKYLADAEMEIRIFDTIENGMDFLSEEIYNPVSAFAIPRNAQSSLGVHVGPIPGLRLKRLDTSTVLNPKDLALVRSTSNSFYNTVIYQYDQDVLEPEKFRKGVVYIDAPSLAQVKVGNKPLVVKSKGLRSLIGGAAISNLASERRLRKYRIGAQTIKGVKVNFKTGYTIEIGDKVIVDMSDLKITDISTGTRSGITRLFEVINKTMSVKTGVVTLDIQDTNLALDRRYALIGPASLVSSGASTTQFTITASYNTTQYGSNEYKKWDGLVGTNIVVRSSDYTTSGNAILTNVSGNILTVGSSLGFTPSAGYIVECGDYDAQADDAKLVYGSMSNDDNDFADGQGPYQQS